MCAVMRCWRSGKATVESATQEFVLASRLKRQLARSGEVHHKALTAEHGAFPSTDLACIETDVLGERDKVARVLAELLARAEFDLLDGTMGVDCESAVAGHAKQDETLAGEEGLGPTPFWVSTSRDGRDAMNPPDWTMTRSSFNWGRAKRWPNTPNSPSTPASRSTFVTPSRRGNVDRTRTPTGCYVNTFPKTPTWQHSPKATSTSQPTNSTAGLE